MSNAVCKLLCLSAQIKNEISQKASIAAIFQYVWRNHVPCPICFVTRQYMQAYENFQELQQINYLASISSNRCWASSMYTLPATGVLSDRHAVPLAHGWLALDDVRMVYSMYTILQLLFFQKKEQIKHVFCITIGNITSYFLMSW